MERSTTVDSTPTLGGQDAGAPPAMERPAPPATAPEAVVSRRPWGGFTQYCLNQPVTVKIISVEPGCELSLQRHRHRAELWIPLDPTLRVEVDGRSWEPAVDEPVWIPAGAAHRLSAPGERGGRILEVAFGHFDEDDIERLADRYGRA
ncbi:MAG TPA: phosphomannose isomerase type II C-terminal cupin domain [Chloroflexota bacterium]|jgi:mannose-6-phosphate isomerase|nr:phosphomannose isomerase type II C-terminal cupin domain [Chloroflexota bacterium]